jgi:hypothetical protein
LGSTNEDRLGFRHSCIDVKEGLDKRSLSENIGILKSGEENCDYGFDYQPKQPIVRAIAENCRIGCCPPGARRIYMRRFQTGSGGSAMAAGTGADRGLYG